MLQRWTYVLDQEEDEILWKDTLMNLYQGLDPMDDPRRGMYPIGTPPRQEEVSESESAKWRKLRGVPVHHKG